MTEAGYARILLDKKDTQIMELESEITKLRIEYERQIKELQEENERLKSKEYFVGDKNRQNMELQQKLEAKEKQIEKMKCCTNCKHFKPLSGCMVADKPIHRQCDAEGDNWKSWELAEK